MANIVKHDQIYANWEKYMRSSFDKTPISIWAPNTISKRNKKRLDDNEYSMINYQESCQQPDCFQYYGLKRLKRDVR